MSGWASILSAASALLGTLAGFWATARKRAEENAEMRVQLAGLLTLTEELRQEQDSNDRLDTYNKIVRSYFRDLKKKIK